MVSPNSVTILELRLVAPATTTTVSGAGLSLPLTFFDARFFRFPPAERVYFYKLNSTPTAFHSEIIPTLKLSLSLVLIHFLPLAGYLTWAPHDASPTIFYSSNDAVAVAVAESNADFERLTGDQVLEVAELRPYIPELSISDTMASIISLQITLFPDKGFSIGISMNHSVLDGKSVSMFLKAWAHISRNIKIGKFIPLSTELTPSFDRTIIKDPDELLSFYLKQWQAVPGLDSGCSKSNPRTVKLLSNTAGVANNLVRATFQLIRERIDRLKETILSYLQQNHAEKDLHLSTLVIACAYISVCLVKARGGDCNRKVYCLMPVDCRGRLDSDPPIPQNYFGNCLYVLDINDKAGTFCEENGVAVIAKKLSDSIKGLMENGSSIFEDVKERHTRMRSEGGEVQKIGITGSPRFAYYEEDFGWGKPEKVEIVSIDRVNGVSLMESKDGSCGIEIGLVLPRHEMETFASLFSPI